jgi:hypothetical protein
MKKEFVPYELAVRLKPLGFNENCIMQWHYSNDLIFCVYNWGNPKYKTNLESKSESLGDCISAPTFSQAFRWFREKHNVRQNIMDFIDDEVGIEWDYEIATIGTDLDENGNYKPLIEYSTDDENRKFKTYEEAELACLTKLIEILETRTN